MMIWLNHGGGAGPGRVAGGHGERRRRVVEPVRRHRQHLADLLVRADVHHDLVVADHHRLHQVLTGSYGLNSSYYLSSVQAGVEVWTGEGQIDSNSYSVTVG